MATPMMDQYFDIKKEYPHDIVLIRMGDFFEMFHEDAIEAHSILGITLTKRNHGKGKASQIPLAGFPHHQLEPYLAKILNAGKRAVVVEQTEDPKKAKGLVKRGIVRIVTAGTNLSDEALTNASNQFLAALLPEGDRVGIALCDVTTGEFTAGSMGVDALRDRLDALNPSEVICNEDQRSEVRDWVDAKTMLTPIPPWIFDEDFSRDTLKTHFMVASLKGFGLEDDSLASRAAGAALHYIRENLRTDPTHIRGLSRMPVDNYLLLDSSTRRNLEIVEPARGMDASTTLFAHLDRTVTPAGKRLFYTQILRPMQSPTQMNYRLDGVEEFFKNNELREGIRDRFRGLGDLERLTARLSTNRGTPRDVGSLRETLRAIPSIICCLESAKSTIVMGFRDRLDSMDEFVDYLGESIVDDPPNNMLHGGIIREGMHERLDELRTIARGGKDFILKRQEEERESTGIHSLSIGYNKVFGYYIEVTKVHQDKVPDYYIRKQTLVNAERYITPELKEWEEKILNAEEEALELERMLFEQVRSRIASEAVRIQGNARSLAELDTLSAAADLAVNQRYSRPVIREDGRLKLVRSRHPVIENLLPAGESFVTNDLDIGAEDRQIALVTGPNMGGKSTYLRQIGLIVLMAHAGLFVPADEAEVPVTDRIFTRVGASDNLAGGESTFLVEMHEAANILHNASGKSLILLDEIGRGTSTFDGLSIAWSIVEYLHDYPGGSRPRTLFATHYHELTELESVLERVFNLHVQVKEWGERVVFLRKVVPGRSGASYGIQVARLAGVPLPVIERAKEVLATLEANEITENNLPRLAAGSGARMTVPPKQNPLQMTLFTAEEKAVREELRAVDPNNMTPMEALRLLCDLKEKYTSVSADIDAK